MKVISQIFNSYRSSKSEGRECYVMSTHLIYYGANRELLVLLNFVASLAAMSAEKLIEISNLSIVSSALIYLITHLIFV